MSLDLRQLEIIRAIAEAGSFTGAGERLHVSQSAISRQILLLEEELNEAVFLRVGRRIRITPAGEALLQLSHRVFQDLKDTVALISDSRRDISRAYGVFDEQGSVARRTTFVIDRKGVVQKVFMAQEALDPNSALEACALLKEVK